MTWECVHYYWSFVWETTNHRPIPCKQNVSNVERGFFFVSMNKLLNRWYSGREFETQRRQFDDSVMIIVVYLYMSQSYETLFVRCLSFHFGNISTSNVSNLFVIVCEHTDTQVSEYVKTENRFTDLIWIRWNPLLNKQSSWCWFVTSRCMWFRCPRDIQDKPMGV